MIRNMLLSYVIFNTCEERNLNVPGFQNERMISILG